MKKMISYPHIEQFRNVIKAIQYETRYAGVDDNGEAIYNMATTLPKITFHGTIKLHGTNAGISYNKEDGMWYQSRKRIITVDKDNAGFAMFSEKRKSIFQGFFDILLNDPRVDPEMHTLSIFGECGVT